MNDPVAPLSVVAVLGLAIYLLFFYKKKSNTSLANNANGWGAWYMTYNVKPIGNNTASILYPLSSFPMDN